MLTQPYLVLYVNWLRALTKVSPAIDLLVVSEDRESCQWLRASGLGKGAQSRGAARGAARSRGAGGNLAGS